MAYKRIIGHIIIEDDAYIATFAMGIVSRQYNTLADYCSDAELCLTRTNVSIPQIQDDIKLIGVGRKSIKFFMNEVD